MPGYVTRSFSRIVWKNNCARIRHRREYRLFGEVQWPPPTLDDDHVDFRRLRDLLEILSELYLSIFISILCLSNKIIMFKLLFIKRDHQRLIQSEIVSIYFLWKKWPPNPTNFWAKEIKSNLRFSSHLQSLIILPIFVIVWDRFDRVKFPISKRKMM